jgi:type I restriction enzyme S subunit
VSKSWPLVPLGEVLKKSEESVSIDPNALYREVTIKLWGKGVVVRREASGTEIAAPRRALVRQGQFILSRIDARNGAFGLVPELLDGAVVSNDFPSFNLNLERLEPRFLEWLSKTSAFIDLCKAASEGTTNRVRLKEEKFLAMAIPLQPLAEQQRIVARIDELAAKIEEALGLRRQTVEEVEALCRSIVFGDSNAVPTPMYELVKQRGHDVQVKANQTYHFAGVYCFGKGVFRGQKKSGMDFAYKQLGQLKAGNFVYPKLMAWEGAFGVVPQECDGLFVSPEFPIFEIIKDRVLPETVDVYFRTPFVWPLIAGESTGTNVRRRRLNPKDFLAYKIPLPTMQTQLRLRQVMQKVMTLKLLQAETAAELDAMLPSILDKAFRGAI